MPPSFPEYPRLELQMPPLELVVCQVRFPLILGLDERPPSDFQKMISDSYPISRKNTATNYEIEIGSGQGPRAVLSHFWGFQDKDSIWTVSIGSNFLSLETKKYQNFNSFLERFSGVFGIAQQLYGMKIRERLGLRYVDRIAKSRCTELSDDWSKSIPKETIPLRSLQASNEAMLSNFETRFFFDDKVLAIRSAFKDQSVPGSGESELMLDFDCYTEMKSDLQDLGNLLREFRDLSYRAFRWSVGDLISQFEVVKAEVR
jgi:uncharacterized protein (TIGR04255 family)